MTLIEVLAALAILGSLLAGLALARSRSVHQWKTAQQRLEAIRAADELLCQWWRSTPPAVPRESSGTCGPNDAFEWRTSQVQRDPAEGSGLRIVRLEIRHARGGGELTSPLASVELAVTSEGADVQKEAIVEP